LEPTIFIGFIVSIHQIQKLFYSIQNSIYPIINKAFAINIYILSL